MNVTYTSMFAVVTTYRVSRFVSAVAASFSISACPPSLKAFPRFCHRVEYAAFSSSHFFCRTSCVFPPCALQVKDMQRRLVRATQRDS